jgi:hypothetical protein
MRILIGSQRLQNPNPNPSATKASAKINQTNYHVWKNTAKSVLIIAGKWPFKKPTELQAQAAIPADTTIGQKGVPAFVPDPTLPFYRTKQNGTTIRDQMLIISGYDLRPFFGFFSSLNQSNGHDWSRPHAVFFRSPQFSMLN